jgi:hypothetical protein
MSCNLHSLCHVLSAGDILPTTPLEVFLAMLFMLCGVSMVALLIGSMTELLTQATSDARRAHALRQKMTEVRWYGAAMCTHFKLTRTARMPVCDVVRTFHTVLRIPAEGLCIVLAEADPPPAKHLAAASLQPGFVACSWLSCACIVMSVCVCPLVQVDEWVQRRNIPSKLARAITNYYK